MRQGFLFGRRLIARASFAGMATALVASLALGGTFAGCDNGRTKLTKEQEEQGMGRTTTHSTTRTIRLPQRCKLDELVIEPKEGSPEAVVYTLLDAANSKADDDASYARFGGLFDSSKAQKFVRKEYWPKARRNVTKYIQGDAADGVSFKVCRREEKKKKNTVKLYIQSLDSEKSNPPITMKKVDSGEWKIIAYTP